MEQNDKETEFDPKVLVEHIDSFGKRLADLIDNPPDVYSPKQIKIINRIYDEKCWNGIITECANRFVQNEGSRASPARNRAFYLKE